MECSLVWNQIHDFKIEQSRRASFIYSHKFHTKIAQQSSLTTFFWNSKTQLLQYKLFSLHKSFIDQVLSWFVKMLQKLSSFFCNLIGFSKQAFKSDWLSYFSKTVLLAGKKMKFKAWNGVIKIIWMIANQTAKIIYDFKMDVINAVNLRMWCCDYSF